MKLIELYVKNSLLLSKTNTEIKLDFRKSDRILNIIIGQMGSGKTALMGLMHPFATYGTLDKRNENSIFIPEKDGIKRTVFRHDGNYYTCEHHGKWVKDHHTIKSYFKINDEEMNPNGNQSSFKDLVKLHLGIDQSYLALLRLGANVENLIDKTSADRKAYISSKVKDTEFYTLLFKSLKDEYRTFNAQSSILTNKLQSLSSDRYDDYRDALVTSNNDLITLNDQKETLIKTKYSYKSEIDKYLEGMDYDKATRMLEHYKEDKLNEESVIKELSDRIDLESNHTPEEYMQILSDLRAKLNLNKEEIRKLDLNHSKNSDILSKLQENLKIAQNDVALKSMKDAYRELNEQMILYEKELQGFKVEQSSMMLKSLVDMIDNINQLVVDISEYDRALISKLYGSDSTILGYAKKQIEIIGYRKIKLQNQMSTMKYSETYITPSVLYIPPFCPCTKGGCPYVETHPATIKKMTRNKNVYDEKLKEIQDEIKELDNEIYRYTEYPTIFSLITQFKKQWKSISGELKTLGVLKMDHPLKLLTDPTSKKWFDYDKLMTLISLAEKRERYYKISERYEAIKAEITSLTKFDEATLIHEINFYNDQVNEDLNRIISLEEENKRLNEDILHYEELYQDLLDIERLKFERDDRLKDIDVLERLIDKLQNGLVESRVLQEKIVTIDHNLNEIEKRIQAVNDNITKLNYVIKDIEYTRGELDDTLLNLKYYELLIRASSSKEGIPLEYIKIFLSKTKEKINRLIDGVFEDDIEILDFVITETEFKIPYMINGQVVEDIAALSQGQTSIITLALSFALVDNLESPYNIFLLDEVDGALYEADRRKFLNILLNQIKEVGIEQIFLTTHNRTFEGTPINVIMTTPEPFSEDGLTTIMKVY